MNRTGWFLLNMILAAAAALATRAILRDSGATSPRRSPAAVGSKTGQSVIPAAAAPVSDSHSALVTAVLGEADTLWKKSLFRPDRTEEVTSDGTAPAATAPAAIQFELIGVGVIADKAAAIILVKSNRTATRRRPTRGGRVQPRKPEPEKKRHVYKLGDSIGDTGYVVKEIKLTEVTVARGNEEQVLKLERSDASSKKRREDAAREQANRKRKAAAIGAKHGAAKPRKAAKTPGMPPPPPPPPIAGPGGAGPAGGPPVPGKTTTPGKATTPAATSYRERMLRALEARRRILARQKSKATP